MIRIYLLAAAAAVLASPAFAEVDYKVPEKTVTIDRSKLDDSAYVRTLYAQIEAAADEVCEQQFKHSWQRHYFKPKCLDAAVGQAVEDIDAPVMTEYAEGRRDGIAYASR